MKNYLQILNKKLFKDIFYIFSITILIIVSTELILFTLHKTFKIKYFENFYESKLRYDHFDIYIDLKNKKKEILNNPKKKKLAIFGGSSAKGFGVNHSFYNLIDYVLKDNYIVHNYSLNESSFYNNQKLILEKVIKFYDKIFIYAGHNEIYPYLINKNKFIILPSGNSIGSNDYYNYRDYYLAIVDQIFLGRINFFSFNYFRINILNKSRIFNILQKISFYFNKKHISFLSKKSIPVNFIKIEKFGKNINKKIIDKTDKETIAKNYINELISLKKNNPDKEIIISEVLSNYFFPPLSNYININNKDELENLEKNYLDLYKELISAEYSDKNYLNLKSKTSHDYAINSIICIKSNIVLVSECHDLAIISNEKDNLPLRIIPILNKKIRSLNPKDFKIINFTDKLKNIKSYNNFNSLFIDFQHPSEKGHLMIANEVLKILNFPKIESEINSNCFNPQLSFKEDIIQIPIKYSEKELKEMRIIFLQHFYNDSLIKDPITFFINDAKKKKMCKSKINE